MPVLQRSGCPDVCDQILQPAKGGTEVSLQEIEHPRQTDIPCLGWLSRAPPPGRVGIYVVILGSRLPSLDNEDGDIRVRQAKSQEWHISWLCWGAASVRVPWFTVSSQWLARGVLHSRLTQAQQTNSHLFQEMLRQHFLISYVHLSRHIQETLHLQHKEQGGSYLLSTTSSSNTQVFPWGFSSWPTLTPFSCQDLTRSQPEVVWLNLHVLNKLPVHSITFYLIICNHINYAWW